MAIPTTYTYTKNGITNLERQLTSSTGIVALTITHAPEDTLIFLVRDVLSGDDKKALDLFCSDLAYSFTSAVP